MKITTEAVRKIEQIRIRQHKPKWTGLRLGIDHGKAFIKWETHKPRDSDLILIKRAIPLIVNETAYSRLQNCTLDFIAAPSARSHFCLRHAGQNQGSHACSK